MRTLLDPASLRIKISDSDGPVEPPHPNAGEVIRALAWLGPEEVEDSLESVLPTLSEEDLKELSTVRAIMPMWIAEPLSACLPHG